MHPGSTESIKSYLMHSTFMVFLSIHSVLKELQTGELILMDVKDVSIERFFTSYISRANLNYCLKCLFGMQSIII